PDAVRRYKSPQELKEALADAVQGGQKATVTRPITALTGGEGGQPKPSGSKVSEQLPVVLAPTGGAEQPPTQPQNIVQSSTAGTTMTPTNAPPPKVSGPQAQVPGSVDEDQERFLITKEDKMDYGPFPL